MTVVSGIPAPIFSAPSHANPKFAFGSLGGRYVLLAFLPGPGPEREAALQAVLDCRGSLSDDRVLVFGVLPDRESFERAREVPNLIRWFLDDSGLIGQLYDARTAAGELAPQWVVVDPSQRVLGSAPLDHARSVLARVIALGSPDDHAGVPLHAPVLIVPRVLEPDFCRELIAVYKADGGSASGVMQERDGKTIGVLNESKKRRDAPIPEGPLQERLRWSISRRLVPQIERAFQYKPTRIERYIVACYPAGAGYFRPHRDNTTPGTAHRRFAVSINLNSEEFEGGDLRFPEYGSRTYRPPTGGAVVFSCSLLHEATIVTRGDRYATLPFLYDEEGVRIREANLSSFEEGAFEAAGARLPEPQRLSQLAEAG
jgi:predicted 2-oxoglutarate/Fe(II)-dependent dioxygenase YbiX